MKSIRRSPLQQWYQGIGVGTCIENKGNYAKLAQWDSGGRLWPSAR